MERREFARNAGIATAAALTTSLVTAAPASAAPPDGPAGGVLSGTYPNPAFAADMATQAELDAVPELAAGDDITVTTTGNVTTVSVEPTFASRALASHIAAASNSTVASDATINADAELMLAVETNSVYELAVHLLYEAAAAADIRIGFSGPAGAVLNWGVSGLGSSVAAGTGIIDRNARIITATALAGGNGIGVPLYAHVTGVLLTSSTSGLLRFQWSQGTSSATGTVRKAGSHMILRRLT